MNNAFDYDKYLAARLYDYLEEQNEKQEPDTDPSWDPED